MPAERQAPRYGFSLSRALSVCANPDPHQTWLSAVHLVQIVLWALTLKKLRNPTKWRPSRTYARKAGLLATSEYLEALARRKKQPDSILITGPDTPKAELVLGLFVHFGGFRALSGSLSWPSFRNRIRTHAPEADAVYLMIDFLVRAKLHDCEISPVLEHAYIFVSQVTKDSSLLADSGLRLRDTDPRTVIKYWDQFRATAPLVYAARRHTPFVFEVSTMEELVCHFHRFCADHTSVKRFLGEAAFAAEMVGRVATTFSVKPYVGITTCDPETKPFSEVEQRIIASIPNIRSGALASPSYRPRQRSG
jgi:hypothetical protein